LIIINSWLRSKTNRTLKRMAYGIFKNSNISIVHIWKWVIPTGWNQVLHSLVQIIYAIQESRLLLVLRVRILCRRMISNIKYFRKLIHCLRIFKRYISRQWMWRRIIIRYRKRKRIRKMVNLRFKMKNLFHPEMI